MDQAVLADIEIAGAGAAAPLVGLSVGEVVLKARDARIKVLEHLPPAPDRGRHVVVHLALDRADRLEMSRAVLDDANGRRESELPRTVVDRPAVLGILDPAAGTELMFTSKAAYAFRYFSFLSRTRRLFFDTSSG